MIRDLLACLDHYRIMLARDGEDVLLKSLLPDAATPPEALILELKRHKPELLHYLDFEVDADAMLLDSSLRMVEAWPRARAKMEGPWQQVLDTTQADICAAYRDADLVSLEKVLGVREGLMLSMARSNVHGRLDPNEGNEGSDRSPHDLGS